MLVCDCRLTLRSTLWMPQTSMKASKRSVRFGLSGAFARLARSMLTSRSIPYCGNELTCAHRAGLEPARQGRIDLSEPFAYLSFAV